MSGNSPLHDFDGTACAPSPVPAGSILARPLDPRRDTLDRWSAALARRDDAEVNRLVRQSRTDPMRLLASEQVGAMPERGDLDVDDRGARADDPQP